MSRSRRPPAVRGRPTLPRLVSGARNFLNCKTSKWCGRCTRWAGSSYTRTRTFHHARGRARLLCQLQKPNKSRRNVFARLCEAKSCELTAQKADCIPGRDDFYAGSGWGKGSFAISPSHPASSLHIAHPLCLTRISSGFCKCFQKGYSLVSGLRAVFCHLSLFWLESNPS